MRACVWDRVAGFHSQRYAVAIQFLDDAVISHAFCLNRRGFGPSLLRRGEVCVASCFVAAQRRRTKWICVAMEIFVRDK